MGTGESDAPVTVESTLTAARPSPELEAPDRGTPSHDRRWQMAAKKSRGKGRKTVSRAKATRKRPAQTARKAPRRTIDVGDLPGGGPIDIF